MKNALTILIFLAFLPILPGQGKALQRAILIEEKEHDADQAARLYKQIAADPATSAADRTQAWFRLGQVLRRKGEDEAANNALAEAAKGEGSSATAAKELLAKGGQDAERVRSLRAQARAVLKSERGNGGTKELRWIGVEAVPEIIAAYDAQWRTGTATRADLLWTIGGPHARTFLAGVLAQSSVKYKSALALGVGSSIHSRLVDLACAFAEDHSLPDESSLKVVSHIWQRVPKGWLIELAGSGRAKLAVAAWNHLFATVMNSSDEDIRSTLDQALPASRMALSRPETLVRAAAASFLCRNGSLMQSGTELILDQLPSWLPDMQFDLSPGAVGIPPGRILSVAQHLGKFDGTDTRGAWLRKLAGRESPGWVAEHAGEALQLVRLGYFAEYRLGSGPRHWIYWFADKGTLPEFAGEIVETLDAAKLLGALSVLSRFRIPASAYPALLHCWDESLPERSKIELLRCIGNTGAEPALAFLTGRLEGDEKAMTAKCAGLSHLVGARDTAPVRQALREAIASGVRRFKTFNPVPFVDRLIQSGDPKVIEMLPGLPGVRNWILASPLVEHWKNEKRESRHGFDAAGLANAWSFLLDQDDGFWNSWSLLPMSGTSPVRLYRHSEVKGESRPRPEVVRMLLPKLNREVVQSTKSGEPLSNNRSSVLTAVLNLPTNWVDPDPASVAAIQDLTTACLASSNVDLQRSALAVLISRPPQPAQRPLVLRILAGTDNKAAQEAGRVTTAHIQLADAEMSKLFATGSSSMRLQLGYQYLPNWSGTLPTAAVVACLSDADIGVRIWACTHLGQRCDVAAVPPLIKVLQDPHPQARTAAHDALEAIRFYHEQKAHWDRVFAGTDLSPGNAAEELLNQAKVEQKKDIRLLALRSLGLLGKVETIPALIRFSKEADPEIAAAARQAIDEVHQRAARAKK